MAETALSPGLVETLVAAVTTTGAKTIFALPARACVLAWQTSFNEAPSAIDIDLEVSIDGVVFTVLDTSTAVGGEARTIAEVTAAQFVRVNVITNTGSKELTVTLIAKVANP